MKGVFSMLKQLEFIPIILNGLGQAYHLYATDILYQLFKQKDGMSIDNLIAFFRHRNQLIVWETIMLLLDLGLIKTVTSKSTNHFVITTKGLEKIHMILACFNIGLNTPIK